MPEQTSALEWAEWQFRLANEAAGIALWSWNVDTDFFTMDDFAYRLWGLPNTGSITFERLSACIHPEDLDKVRASFAATHDISGPYETDFRILRGDETRWISARGRGDGEGMVGRVMFGIFIDVSVRKMAEEAREMITGEMNHRIKNLFAIMSSLTAFSARSTSSKDEMARDLSRRLQALSLAHDLVRTSFHEGRDASPLSDLLTALLGPYAGETPDTARIRITAPDILVGESAITALALIVHELATNAVKYGALSNLSGLVEVTCTANAKDVTILWKETGGPPILGPKLRDGFGSQLVSRSISGQLGGSIHVAWPREGIDITLRASRVRLEQ